MCIEGHKQEDVKTNRHCCFNHIIGLPGSTYNGTAMKEGPVSNVPIGITLSDNGNISIMIDPKTTDNHFGNTPIEGKVTTA